MHQEPNWIGKIIKSYSKKVPGLILSIGSIVFIG
jgi:hypothetical protein